MRTLPLALALALASAGCSGRDAQPGSQPIASAANPSALKPAANHAEKKDLPAPPARKDDTSTLRAAQPLKVDPSRKLEIVEVTVDTRDPSGMRRLVPYILRDDEWMILKVEWTSATTRHYRFQRMISPNEPSVVPDPLLLRKRT